MSDDYLDEPGFPELGARSDDDSELLTTPRLGEDKRGVALSVLWWVEAGEDES